MSRPQNHFWPLVKIASILILFFTLSCRKSDDRIRRELKHEAQRGVNGRKAALRPLMDSLCTLNYTAELRRLTDSLYQIRKEEVEKIIDF